jgi:hypothetical protein
MTTSDLENGFNNLFGRLPRATVAQLAQSHKNSTALLMPRSFAPDENNAAFCTQTAWFRVRWIVQVI